MEIAVAARPAGTDGAVVSGAPCVVALTAVEAAETLPAASKAETVYEYEVDAVSLPRDNQGETAASIRMRMRRGWTDGSEGVARAKFVRPRRRTFPQGVSAVWRS